MKAKPDSPQLAFSNFLKNSNTGFYQKDGSGFFWAGTHFQGVSIEDLEYKAMMYLAKNYPNRANAKLASSAASTAILLAPKLPKPAESLIPVANGHVKFSADGITLIPADEKYGLTYVLNCNFDPGSNCPLFSKFLAYALPDQEVRDFLQEYAGYTLLGDTRYQKAAWLVGEGGTGKSTLVQVMQSMHRQTIALSLDALDGFKLVGLQSASLVCVDETPPRINEQRLKTLISGDSIQIDRKFRDPLTLCPTAKWFVNANLLPAISDHSTGFWRRWFIFPFNVKPVCVQPLLAESIIAHELSGILNWCLQGLNRLLLRDSFPELPSPMIDALQAGKQQSNSVAEWVEDDGIVFGANAENARVTVYKCYSQWCQESNVKALGVQKFWERLRVIFPDLPDDRLANRKMVGGKRRAVVQITLPQSFLNAIKYWLIQTE